MTEPVRPDLTPTPVQRASAADLPEILALLEAAQLPGAGVTEWIDHFVIARHDGALLGAAGTEQYGDNALLRSVVVSPAARGLGLGGALVEHALQLAYDAGVRTVYLLTTTAQDWFPRHQFQVIPRDQVPATVQTLIEFRGACPDTAAVMRRTLLHRGER